jgi:hypothetical protein
LPAGQASEHRASLGQRERHVLEPEACYFLDHVDLSRDVARAPGRRDETSIVDVEAQSAEQLVLLAGWCLDADQPVGLVGPVADDRSLRELALDVRVSDPARAGKLDDELGRERCGRLRQVGVHTLLPAIRAFGA